MKALVIGAGAWGTTFAQVLADAGHEAVVWTTHEPVAEEINTQHTNSRAIAADVVLPSAVTATTDLAAHLAQAELIVVALPSQVVREVLTPYRDVVNPAATVVSLMKGVELATLELASQVLAEIWSLPPDRVAVVSGPNLAGEIARREPTTTVVACTDESVAQRVAETIATPYFRVFTSTDVIGLEVGGAVKNVIALAVGIAEGMGYGYNMVASIMTRGLSEGTRIGVALGAERETFLGLAGVGDLIATCSSPSSRNHRLGSYIGKGLSLAEAIEATGATAEGAKSCGPILELARRHGVKASVIGAVVGVVHEGRNPAEVLRQLQDRPPRAED